MKLFRTRNYHIINEKLSVGSSIKLALLADLHGITYGHVNEEIIHTIMKFSPDIVLFAGDMIVRHDSKSEIVALRLIEQLSLKFPIYYAMGNHESKMFSGSENSIPSDYEQAVENLDICLLRNETKKVKLNNQYINISGLELPLNYFKKPNPPELNLQEMNKLLNSPKTNDNYHILLAHTPRYMETYFSWGADLILSGHYHGGVIRFNENYGMISPQMELFPKFCCGHFQKDRQNAIVSAGLGIHSIPIRIHNPAELIFITISNR